MKKGDVITKKKFRIVSINDTRYPQQEIDKLMHTMCHAVYLKYLGGGWYTGTILWNNKKLHFGKIQLKGSK